MSLYQRAPHDGHMGEGAARATLGVVVTGVFLLLAAIISVGVWVYRMVAG